MPVNMGRDQEKMRSGKATTCGALNASLVLKGLLASMWWDWTILQKTPSGPTEQAISRQRSGARPHAGGRWKVSLWKPLGAPPHPLQSPTQAPFRSLTLLSFPEQ